MHLVPHPTPRGVSKKPTIKLYRFATEILLLTLAVVLLDVVSNDFTSLAQSPRVSNYAPTSSSSELSNESSKGISFTSLAPDGKGGVWISGGVLYSGLLLHATPAADPRLVPELRRIGHLAFPTAASGWMVSEGTVYSTQDSIHWNKVEVGKTDELEKVYFFNDRLGWVYGRSGTIYRTTNGGQKWQEQNSGTDYEIRQVQFVNPLEGWATAAPDKPGDRSDSHVFLSTRDGGNHWKEIPRGKTAPVEAFWFVSDLEGWAVDYDSNIVHTTDRGWTWQVQRSGANSSFASIHFVDSLHGWAAGDGILHTSDGGVTWKYQIAPEGVVGKSSFDLIHFLDAQNGWALDFFHVMFTQDGGKNWQPLAEDWRESTFDKAVKQQEARVNKQNQPN